MIKNYLLILGFVFTFSNSFSQTLNDSLKAHYKFDGTVLDASLNGEDLKYPTSPDYRVVIGTDSSYYFDGNERLESDSSFDNSSFAETAISLWLKTSTKTSQSIIQGAYIGFGVFIEGPGGKVSAFFDGSSSGAIKSVTNVADNKWHHILTQNNGNKTELYIDGVFIKSINETLYNGTGGSNNKIYIGDNRISSASYTGELNEVRIYNRTLNACEIIELADTNILETNLKAHYKFDGDVLDASENNEDIKSPTSPKFEVVSGTDSAYHFDGSTRLELKSNFDNSTYNQTALSCWVKTSSKSKHEVVFSGAYLGFGIVVDINGKASATFDGSSVGSITSLTKVTDDEWHHIFAQNNGDTTNIYIDGILENSIAESLYNGTGASNNIIYFGNSLTGPSNNSGYYKGLLNDVRIYDRMLGKCEIDSLYQLNKPEEIVYCDSTGLTDSTSLQMNLKAYFKFDGDVLDATDNNEDLKTPTNPDYRKVIGTDSAYYFDGNTRLESDMPFDNSSYSQTALSCWIKTSSKSKHKVVFSGAYLGFGIVVDINGKASATFDGSSVGSITSLTGVTDDEWHHILAQNDGDTTNIYIDGILENSIAESLYNGTGASNNIIYFGNSRTGPSNNSGYYDGLLNDVRIYDRVLGNCEIDSLYQQLKPDTSVVTSIDKIASKASANFSIYPNPTIGDINLLVQDPKAYSGYRVKNSIGQIILEEKFIKTGINNIKLNKNSGLYLLELIERNGKITTSKIIKD